MHPPGLDDLLALFEHLPEQERRECLLDLASRAARHRPAEGEPFDLDDVRRDRECTDTVGIHLRVDEAGRAHFAVSLGPAVQTLTRAMAVILCRGLEGATLEQVLQVAPDFVPRIVGAELVRLRSRTVYYLLDRMKAAARTLQDRRSRGGGG